MKLHLSINVTDQQKAVEFYSQLFGMNPTIEKEGYVKWDVQDPPVNFVIETGCCDSSDGVDHLGIQVENEEELETVVSRTRDSGQPFLDVEKTQCCYAVSDKAWVKGPGSENWEVFLTHSHDMDEYGTDRTHLLNE